MDIAAAVAATTPRTANNDQARSAPSDYDTFLRMLTVQMQNQDPLNPIDSADYAVQLATFSGVEQQTRMNQTLDTMLQRMNTEGIGALSLWVEREVRAPAAIGWQGAPVALDLPAEPRADRAVLAVRSADGILLAREDVSPDGGTYRWQGQAITGGALPQGAYTLSVEHYAGEVPLGSTAVQSWQRVTEVSTGANGVMLRLSGGSSIPATTVSALRAAA